MVRRGEQLDLDLRRWGGRRSGAGRKPGKGRRRVPHRIRESMNRHTPALITLRLVDEIPTLRDRRLFGMIWDAMVEGRERLGGRLIHFSTQSNHIHMIVEAENKKALSRFMAGLKIRIARAINRAMGRSGRVFADRYHPRILRTPTQVRNAIRYVMN